MSTPLTIQEAQAELAPYGKTVRHGDDNPEMFHCTFDNILERKLRELDPTFMKALDTFYDQECGSRWYA